MRAYGGLRLPGLVWWSCVLVSAGTGYLLSSWPGLAGVVGFSVLLLSGLLCLLVALSAVAYVVHGALKLSLRAWVYWDELHERAEEVERADAESEAETKT